MIMNLNTASFFPKFEYLELVKNSTIESKAYMTECSELLSDCKSAISALILQGNAFTEIFSRYLKHELKSVVTHISLRPAKPDHR